MPIRSLKPASRITRRTVLRGAGVTVALPWLESLKVWGAPTGEFPKRFAVLFMGNGVNEEHWNSEGSGAAMKLSKTLMPLEPLKHKSMSFTACSTNVRSDTEFIQRRPDACC